MSCSCSSQPGLLATQGGELFAQGQLTASFRHVRQMDDVIVQTHREVRKIERAQVLGESTPTPPRVAPEKLMEYARRHATQARKEFRTALASDAWSPILEGFDPRRDDFRAGLTDLRSMLLDALDNADFNVKATGEIKEAFDQVASVVVERGVEGLVAFFDDQFSNANEILTPDRDWGREAKSPLEWWQWLIIIGILVISIAALIVCFWWFGCSWIAAIWAFFCVGQTVGGGVFAGFCFGFSF